MQIRFTKKCAKKNQLFFGATKKNKTNVQINFAKMNAISWLIRALATQYVCTFELDACILQAKELRFNSMVYIPLATKTREDRPGMEMPETG